VLFVVTFLADAVCVDLEVVVVVVDAPRTRLITPAR